MRLVYTLHARVRMAEYNVSEADIEHVLAHPAHVARSSHSHNLVYVGRAGGQQISVIVVPGSYPPRVVTLWATAT
jgi:hypothetical protein